MKTALLYILLVALCNIKVISSESNDQRIDSLLLAIEQDKNSDTKSESLKTLDSLVTKTTPNDSLVEVWYSFIDYFSKKNLIEEVVHYEYMLAKELRNVGRYFESLQMLNKVLRHHQQTANLKGIAQVSNSLGILYKNLNDFSHAGKFYLLSIEHYEQLNDTTKIAWAYLNLGSMAEQQGSFDLAKEYLRKSETILINSDVENLINCYINFGEVFKKEGILDSAQHYYSKAYNIAIQHDFTDELFQSAFYIGLFLFSQNKFSEAEKHLSKAELLYSNHTIRNFSISDKVVFMDLISKNYERKQQYKEAYSYSKIARELNDQDKYEQAINNLNRLAFDEKVAEEERKRGRRDLMIILTLAGLVTCLLFLAVLYRNYKHKQKANRLLTEMDELKTRLYSNITHELRTPLTLILGPLEQMLSPDATTTPSYKQIKLMRRNANSLLNLVNQMLDLSKIDAQGLKMELVEQDIVSFIKAHFVAFSSLAERKKIEFNYYLPAERKIRLFDADKLEKVINNLMSNAIKYTPKKGKVFCFASFPKLSRLELIVQDTGDGIATEQLDKIFDRFHQVPGSNVSQLGTGIGLSLTKELVDLMHGEIQVESVVGEGTKFKILLPLGKEHLKPDDYTILDESNLTTINIDHSILSETEEKENLAKPGSNDLPSILIVEDHMEISQFIKDNLVHHYTVNKAENGKIGFEQAIETIPDLIISDVMMPEMDGIEMTGKLKTDERTSHIPIILLTAQTGHKQKLKSLETGIDAFVPKPFNMKELELRIKKLIEQRQRLREKYTSNLKLEPKDVAVTSADEKFLNRVMEIVEKNIGNPDFETKDFQEELLLSRMQLFRKIKALTNQTPGEFIRTIRLKRAASLMEQKYGNIAQITYEIGFNNPSYFAKCFKELYGVLPSEYLKK